MKMDNSKINVEDKVNRRVVIIQIVAFLILLGFAVAGLYHGDLLGNIAFSFLPTAILVNVAVLVALTVERGNLILAKAGWVVLCIAVLLFVFIVGDKSQPNAVQEAGIVLGYPIIILSFPLGIAVVYLYGGLSYLSGYSQPSDFIDIGRMNFFVDIFFFWVWFFIAGYLQWFKLLPLIIEKVNRTRQRNA